MAGSNQPNLSPLEDSPVGVYRVQTTHFDHSFTFQGPSHPYGQCDFLLSSSKDWTVERKPMLPH